MKKFDSPKQMKNIYILTNDESERDTLMNIISNRLIKIKISLQNNLIVCINNLFL